jgi:tetratricopeptide (TPR) repeat protein
LAPKRHGKSGRALALAVALAAGGLFASAEDQEPTPFERELAILQSLLLDGQYDRVVSAAEKMVLRLDRSGQQGLQVAVVLDILVEARLRSSPLRDEPDPALAQELRPLVDRSLGIKRRLLRHDDPEMAVTLVNLGALLLREGRPAQARALFKNSLDIREKAHGAGHPLVGESTYYLALALDREGRLDEALAAYERVLASWENAFGADHANVATCLSKLAELSWRRGQMPDAARYASRNLAILERSFGEDDPRLAPVKNRVASYRLATGNTAGLRELGFGGAADLADFQERALGPGHASGWHEHHDRAEEALRGQDWGGAIVELIRAVEKKAASEFQARAAGRIIDYHPYLKLGIAYYNVGQADKARSAFATEQSLGAIGANASAEKNLSAFRKLVEADASEAEAVSVSEIIDRSLEQSRSLESRGRLDEAVQVLGEALAVAPGDARVKPAMQGLRDRLAQQEQQRDLAARVSDLVGEGAALFAAGDYERASAVLSQAVSLQPSAESRALLEQSQKALAQKIEAQQDAESRRSLVRDGLRLTSELEGADRVSEALAQLQNVLAVEPRNAKGLELRDRLLERQSELESRRSLQETVARLLAEGRELLDVADHQQAAGRFSRVLALDPGHGDAADLLQRALDGMAQALLREPAAAVKVPPSIMLANLAADVDGAGNREERVSRPAYTIAGVIDDDRPDVTLLIRRGADATVVHEAALHSATRRGALYRHHFQQALDLSPGPADLVIAVTDSDGLAEEVRHRVRYVRPLTRSPWFYSAAGLAVAAAAAGAIGIRVRKRNLLLRRRFNPYAAGAPIFDEKMFFGREELLRRILQTIPNNSIALYGERRIGKTSLQHQLRKRLEALDDPTYRFFPVYIDLEGTPQEKFFSTLGHEICETLKPLLDGRSPGAEVPQDGTYDYQALVRDVRKVLEALRAQTPKKVKLALLLDEVDELNEYDPRINQRLRSLFMKSFAEELVAVVSGVGIKKTWEREGSPWFNFFEEIPVEPFRDSHAKELIESPVRGVFEFEDGAVEAILERAERKPYLIQKTCIELVNRMHEEGRRKITRADVESCRRHAIE